MVNGVIASARSSPLGIGRPTPFSTSNIFCTDESKEVAGVVTSLGRDSAYAAHECLWRLQSIR